MNRRLSPRAIPSFAILAMTGLAACQPSMSSPASAGEDGGPWSTSPREETRPLFTTDFSPSEFAARRAGVFDAMGSTGIAVLQGAPSPEGYVRFRQTNEFYYLSGIESPHAYLVLDGASRRTALYLPPRDERREYGEGKILSAEDAPLVLELSGVDEVYPLADLPNHLRTLVEERVGQSGPRVLFTLSTPPEGLSATRGMTERPHGDWQADPLDGRAGRQDVFRANLQELLPGARMDDLTPILDRLRTIKSPAERGLIRASSRLQGLAILETMRSTTPGVTEYEMDAIGKYVYWRHGAQAEAYYALTHIGSNAFMNHYHGGVRAAEPGDMILMDHGGDYRYYVSDMGRMWPANGSFNAVQRELYGFYLAFYEAVLTRIRPGITAQQVKLEALEEIDSIMTEWDFSTPRYRSAAEEFVAAFRAGAQNPDTRLGHWVGMAAHDPGLAGNVLLPGMVFVIEPQFRVPEERIYLRLEDTIAITDDGVEIYTDFVPRDMESIEALVGTGGILQNHPRLLDGEGEFTPPALRLMGQQVP